MALFKGILWSMVTYTVFLKKETYLREGSQLSLGFKDPKDGKDLEKEESWREEVEDAHEQNIVCEWMTISKNK